MESSEDTLRRLAESQFGYQSVHISVRAPETWLSLPTMAGVKDWRIEIQVRTLAQHIWAAASHKLQYKHETSVPAPVRRAIHRVSALLETVDLEFERVLTEREEYVKVISSLSDALPLNADNLAQILDEMLPARNKSEYGEDYSELIRDLAHFGVRSASQLRVVIDSHLEEVLREDGERAAEMFADSPEDVRRSHFYTHAGLVRELLSKTFGSEFESYREKHLVMSEE